MVVRHRACLRGLGLEKSRLLGQQMHLMARDIARLDFESGQQQAVR
jgi:hypothetical protein